MFSQMGPEPANISTQAQAGLSKLFQSDLNAVSLNPSEREDGKVTWNVVFSPMDIQLTDFENSALTVFVAMLANLVNTFDLDFILPQTLVDENMKRAN